MGGASAASGVVTGAKVGQIWVLDDGALKLEVMEIHKHRIREGAPVGGAEGTQGRPSHWVGRGLRSPDPSGSGRHPLGRGGSRAPCSDVQALSLHIKELGGPQTIIAKIEHPQALDNLEYSAGKLGRHGGAW